jgi:hypothetical protein
MALKEDLEAMLIDDKKNLEVITEKLNTLTQEETKLKKSIESVEHLLNHKFGLQINKTRAMRVGEKSKATKLINEIDELGIAYKSIPDGALEIMSEAENKPLHVKEIYQRLIEKGKKIGNSSSVGVALIRDKRFKKIGPNVFVITGEYY